MNSKIIIKYDAETKNPTIECEGSYFSTDRLYGIEIADWAYPFVLNGNRWKGLYDELREFYGMDSYSVIFHGADSDLAVLKQAFAGRPVNVVGLNNKVIIIYDSKQLTTKITVNGKIFNTQRIDNRSIDEWINPFSFKAAKWNGIYKEIEEFLGIDSYSIHFVGNQDDMKMLIENAPDNVNVFYKPPIKSNNKVKPQPSNTVKKTDLQNNTSSENISHHKKFDIKDIKGNVKGLISGAKIEYHEMKEKDNGILIFGIIAVIIAIICCIVFTLYMLRLLMIISVIPSIVFCFLAFSKGYKKLAICTAIVVVFCSVVSFIIITIRLQMLINKVSEQMNSYSDFLTSTNDDIHDTLKDTYGWE